jgi:pre-rRNA-processing protein TSR2
MKYTLFFAPLFMHWKEFRHGLDMIFKKWTGLQLAISYSDYDTAEEDLVRLTAEFFEESTVEVDELENNLEAFVEEQLECQLEDGSPRQVARHVCEFFQQLKQGNLSMYEQMTREFGKNIASAEVSDSDADSDLEDEEQKLPQERKRPDPVIDDDGFELVQKGRRR